MCLAIPGKIISVDATDPLMRIARVDFGGAVKDVSLAYTPEAATGDYVLVHVGFAISRIDDGEAKKVFSYLAEIAELDESQ